MDAPEQTCWEGPLAPPPPGLPPAYGRTIPITPSALCSLGWRPRLLGGLIRDVLIRHFQPPHIEDSNLQQLVWQAGPRSPILIESLYRFDIVTLGKRPAILIKQGSRRSVRLYQSDLAGYDKSGGQIRQKFWMGSHTLFCIHENGASADIVATEAQRELTQFAHELVTGLKLYRFDVTEVGEIAIVEESRQMFVVPVTIGWIYSENWKVNKNSLAARVSKISLSVLLDGALDGLAT